MKTRIFLVSVLLMSICITAQEFKSMAAKAAQEKYQKAI
jgi:hypothetical protein